jgi:hypothetical protein
MSEQLTKYFEDYAETGIERTKKALLAIGFYKRVLDRLNAGDDLSDEMPLIAKVGPDVTREVVIEAILENKDELKAAWQLPKHLQKRGDFIVGSTQEPLEHLPRVEMSYSFTSAAGDVKVRVSTIGENFKVVIDAGKNKVAATLACAALEKHLTFLAFAD